MRAEELAKRFYETISRLAPDHGYGVVGGAPVAPSWDDHDPRAKALLIAAFEKLKQGPLA